jgi:CrcB protein
MGIDGAVVVPVLRCRRVDRLLNFLVVCAGGALGSGSRFLVGLASTKLSLFGKDFPHGTFFVNMIGCFLITLIVSIANATAMPENLRLFLTTGFMGGLTTYSTFDFEVTRFFQEGATVLGVVYLTATVVGCFLAGLLGILAARGAVASPS